MRRGRRQSTGVPFPAPDTSGGPIRSQIPDNWSEPTTTEPEPPHRRLQLYLHLEADNLRELTDALDNIATDLAVESREARQACKDGWTSSYRLVLEVDPAMTGDKYWSLVRLWQAARQERREREGS